MGPDPQWRWTPARAVGAALVAGAAVFAAFSWQPWYLTVPLVVGCLGPFLFFSYRFSPARLGGVALVAVVGGLVVALRVHPWYAGAPALIALAVMILEAQLSLMERGVVLAIGLVLGALLLPSVTADHSRRNRMRAGARTQAGSTPVAPSLGPQPDGAIQRR